MTNRKDLHSLLRTQEFPQNLGRCDTVYKYAESMAAMEHCVAVVSDLQSDFSTIYCGGFADVLGLTGYSHEGSIWESEILNRMSEAEREAKFIAELRFFNLLRRLPRQRRSQHYLLTQLRCNTPGGSDVDVLHRMYYWYDESMETVLYGICLYGPALYPLPAKSVVVNAVTGRMEALTGENDAGILSKREQQVLALIDKGFTSTRIADELCISKHTVSRHRQEILGKLQVKNSTEACRIARQLKLIV